MSEELKAKGLRVLKYLDRIEDLRQQQGVEIKKLWVQAWLMTQGVDPEQLKHWVYDPNIDTRKNRHSMTAPEIYNKVILQDGTMIQIEPILVKDARPS